MEVVSAPGQPSLEKALGPSLCSKFVMSQSIRDIITNPCVLYQAEPQFPNASQPRTAVAPAKGGNWMKRSVSPPQGHASSGSAPGRLSIPTTHQAID